jgi:hypothetical protein
MARQVCAVCGQLKVGLSVNGVFLCDEDLNSPARTRGGFLQSNVNPDGTKREKSTVPLNKVIIRDDDEEGELIAIPSDSSFSAPPSEVEIKKIREEMKNDTRVFVPSNERTLARIGAKIVEEKDATEKATEAETGSRVTGSNISRREEPKQDHARAGKAHRSSAQSKV